MDVICVSSHNSVINIDNDSSIANSHQSKFTKGQSTSTANTNEALIITETFLKRTKLTSVAFHVMTRSEIPDMAGADIPDTAVRKARRRKRTQGIAKHYAFHANAKRT